MRGQVERGYCSFPLKERHGLNLRVFIAPLKRHLWFIDEVGWHQS